MRASAKRPMADLAVLTALAFALHLWTTGRVAHPTVAFDEMGYLGNARWLAGTGGTWEMPTSPAYAVGYPLVLAPLARLFGTAGAQWRAVMIANAAMLTAVVPLAYAIGRRLLDAPHRVALAAAAVGAAAPAVVAAGPSAIAENLAIPLLLATVLAAHLMMRPVPVAARALFGPAVAMLHLVHARFVLVLVLAAGLTVLAWSRRLVPPAVAALNVVLMAAVFGGGRVLTRAVVDARWDHVEHLEGSPGDALSLLTRLSGLEKVAAAAAGQAWYLVAGSLGLSVVGVVALVARVARPTWAEPAADASDDTAEPGEEVLPLSAVDASGEAADAARLAIGFALVAAAMVFATSVAFFTQNQFRADHFIYGRHNDTFTPLWITAAVVALMTWRRAVAARVLGAAAVTTVGLYAILEMARDPGDFGGVYSPFAVPAVIRFVAHDPPGTWWRATLAALAGVAVVALVVLALRRARWLIPVLVVWFVWAGNGTVTATDQFGSTIYRHWTGDEQIAALGIRNVSIDSRAVKVAFPALSYPFHLPDVGFTTYDSELNEEPDQPVVIARVDDPDLRAEDARIAWIDRTGYTPFWGAPDGVALWVRPGPEADRLDKEGALLPVGYPTGLPASARSVSVRLPDDVAGKSLEVAPGGSVPMTVHGRHTGSGSPWPDWAADDGPSRVRVKARVEALDEGLPDGVASGGELPRWLRPGDRFTSRIRVQALGPMLGDLAPGHYRVTVGVGQDEPSWFAPGGPEATFDLVVTEA